MTLKKTKLWIIAVIVGILFTFINPVSAEDVVIIINSDVPDTALSKEDVKKIYSGHKTKWSNNDSIVLTVIQKSELHKAFLKEFVKKTPSQFKMNWKHLMFSGKGKIPKTFNTIEQMVDYVAKNEGAIGYVAASSPTDSVKVIKAK